MTTPTDENINAEGVNPEEGQAVSPLDLPDDQIAEMPLDFAPEASADEGGSDEEVSDENLEDSTDESKDTSADTEDESGSDDGDIDESDVAASSDDDGRDDVFDDKGADTDTEHDDQNEENEDGDGDQSDSDSDTPEAVLAKIMAPFKANGKEIQAKTPEDVIALMQQGANYNLKMAAIKPNLKMIKMLDNNDLLDEGKISYLIDLANKDPQAIAKLVKESNIDPMDLDIEQSEKYEPKTHTVSDVEVQLDEVIAEIKQTPTFAETIRLVNTEWDKTSKEIMLNNPHLIRAINDQKQNGIFDKITAEVANRRVFGKLNGLSDLEAYKTVGDEMEAQGAFASAEQPGEKPAAKKVDDAAKKAAAEKKAKIAAQKKAASPTKKKAGTAKPAPVDILNMSDEEFEKATGGLY